MEYYFSKILKSNFEDSLAKTTEALKTEGFGIITVIDIQASFKEKLGVDFKKYKILGACNPASAYKALQAEDKIGTMLPCNVVVIDKENGTTEVAAVHPLASMMAISNPELEPLAVEISEKLKRMINALQ
jgi:uncharacterized protein (DUF302 family)